MTVSDEALEPNWIPFGLVTVIYGMRGMLKLVLQIIGNRFNLVKHIDTNKKRLL